MRKSALEAKEGLAPLAKAKLDLAKSYTLNSLYYMYLKTQGVNTQAHQVRRELDRVKKFMMKAAELEKGSDRKGTETKVESRKKIKHDDSEEERTKKVQTELKGTKMKKRKAKQDAKRKTKRRRRK